MLNFGVFRVLLLLLILFGSVFLLLLLKFYLMVPLLGSLMLVEVCGRVILSRLFFSSLLLSFSLN